MSYLLVGSAIALGCGQAESSDATSTTQRLTEGDATGGTMVAGLLEVPGDEGGVPAASSGLLAVANPASGILRVLTSRTGSWVESARLRSDALGARRSHRIAVVAAADTVVLGVPRRYVPPSSASLDGAPGEQVGAVEVYSGIGAAWALQTLLDPTGRARTEFGAALALDADFLAIGAPRAPSGGAVHLYRRDGNQSVAVASLVGPPRQVPRLFGSSVVISGNRLFVGAPADSENGYGNGAVYVFDITSARDGRVDLVTVLRADDALPRKAPDCAGGQAPGASLAYCRLVPGMVDGFGSSLALAGGHLAVGAPGAGPDRISEAAPEFPFATGAGAVYVFAPLSGARSGWSLDTMISAPAGVRRFGTTLSGSGEMLAVGAPVTSGGPTDGPVRKGRIETYVRSAETWGRQRALDVSIAVGSDHVDFTPSEAGLIVDARRDEGTAALFFAGEG